MAEKQFYNVAEVAEITGLSPDSIRRYIRTGRIFASRPGGTKQSPYLIPETEILKLKGEKQNGAESN